jgi:hypothetical protein
VRDPLSLKQSTIRPCEAPLGLAAVQPAAFRRLTGFLRLCSDSMDSRLRGIGVMLSEGNTPSEAST